MVSGCTTLTPPPGSLGIEKLGMGSGVTTGRPCIVSGDWEEDGVAVCAYAIHPPNVVRIVAIIMWRARVFILLIVYYYSNLIK